MQNFGLLKALCKRQRRLLPKRGMDSTIKDLLISAEDNPVDGSLSAVCCERGVRAFETVTAILLIEVPCPS
jgi:3-deoxy-7-phosphoheptulonate synthase